jgi:hypothetical protein
MLELEAENVGLWLPADGKRKREREGNKKRRRAHNRWNAASGERP